MNGDVIKMVNVNAITPRRELKLRRDILAFDRMCGDVRINSVSFYEDEQANVVLDILKHWDFQSKLHNDESILYDLIRDSEMTSHLQHACRSMDVVGYKDCVFLCIARSLLELSDNIENDDDVAVIDEMIAKLDAEKIARANFRFDVDAKLRITQALTPVRNYLEKLKNNMVSDEMKVKDIVESESHFKESNGSYDVKLKLIIKNDNI